MACGEGVSETEGGFEKLTEAMGGQGAVASILSIACSRCAARVAETDLIAGQFSPWRLGGRALLR